MSEYDHETYLRRQAESAKRRQTIAVVLSIVAMVLAVASLIVRYFG